MTPKFLFNPSRKILVGQLTLGATFLCTGVLVVAAEPVEEIEVIGISPLSVAGQEINRIPFAVKRFGGENLENSRSLDLTDFMNSEVASVSINSAQNNPLQPDVQFRGFTSSPLLGLSQGIAVYQNGVRVNEPLGDAVNWDLIPESAVYSTDVISGANPVYGLNTLGGAIAVTMKNGFNFSETQIDLQTGSWGRNVYTLESGNSYGLANGSEWGYYINFSSFEEDGWRDESESEAQNFYGSLSWRNGSASSLDLIYQQGDSDLIGNGALPVGQLALDRSSIFTAPDITENDMQMFALQGSHFITGGIQFSGNVFWRENTTDSFNGDGSEFEVCNYSGGAQSLFEEADDIEDALEDDLGIELDDICEGSEPSITDFDDLEDAIEDAALLAGMDPEDYELEDAFDDLSGTGILSDEAINNVSRRDQTSQGFNTDFALDESVFGFDNQLLVGMSWFEGEADFVSVVELAELDPVTRSTAGLGTGTFWDEGETDVRTSTETWSLYFVNTWSVNDQLALTFAGRYNDTDIQLRDQSGERPELNGDHNFTRFNPSVGFTYDLNEATNFYGSYSESSRVPTPIELACNEGVFEVAQQYAIAAGEDPDDLEFECRLPNAFLADPPLNAVITKSIELGVRGNLDVLNSINYQLGFFNANNEDDIIFQTTGRSTGLFANVDETRRRGIEAALQGSVDRLDWYASYSLIKATFEDDFNVLSPNHPNADAEGELAVESGDRIPGLPENIFKVGGNYHFTQAFSVGAEVIYNSDQVIRGDESNDLDTVDGYAVANLMASYAASDNFLLYAKVSNVFDREYENFGLLGEDPTGILDNLVDDTPVFVGVGAPRGVWAGVRYRF